MRDIVPTLETCMALKENGFPQITYFYWWEDPQWELRYMWTGAQPVISAPTAEEVLRECGVFVKCWKSTDNYYYCEKIIETVGLDYQTHGESLSEALAQMYLYLKKEGLL